MQRRTIVYLILSFGFSWALFGLAWSFGLFRNGVGLTETPFLFLFMWGPAVGAVAATLMFDRSRWREVLGISFSLNWWWVAAAFVPAILVLIATYASTLLPNVRLVGLEEVIAGVLPDQVGSIEGALPPLPVLLLVSFLSGVTFNGVLTLTEELGWRGYLWSLWKPLGFWRLSVLTGLVWGAWHAPIIAVGHNYPGEPVRGPLMMTAFTMLACPLIGHLRERAGSVFAASIFHGVINAVAPISVLMVATENVFLDGFIGVPGFVVLALANLALFWGRRASNPIQAPST